MLEQSSLIFGVVNRMLALLGVAVFWIGVIVGVGVVGASCTPQAGKAVRTKIAMQIDKKVRIWQVALEIKLMSNA